MSDALERLEAWVHVHKANNCQIDIDDGFGATCWVVRLYRTHADPHEIIASEVSFFMYEVNDVPRNVVFCREPDDGSWPGLAAVIDVALERAKELWG